MEDGDAGTEHSPGAVRGAQGVPPAPGTMLSLQPGAPNVLEQGPERRNCHTTRVQLVSFGGDGHPRGCRWAQGAATRVCRGTELPQWVPGHP